jgi:hypothetical protein
MLFDTEYSFDRLLRDQPSLGRFVGADRRTRFPSGQAPKLSSSALLTPLPWRPVRRNLDEPPPHDTSGPSTRAG